MVDNNVLNGYQDQKHYDADDETAAYDESAE